MNRKRELVVSGFFATSPQAMHATKKPKMILIDGENVPDQLELLSQISDSDVRIYLFLGPTQAKVPTDLWERFQPLGERVKIVRMKGTGKNSLDFLMAFHFGSLSKETRNADYYILSKDKGFDPLVLHVRENEHISCERKEKAQDIFSQKRDSRDPGTAEKRAEMFLQNIKTRTRPRKLAKLRHEQHNNNERCVCGVHGNRRRPGRHGVERPGAAAPQIRCR